MVTNSSVVSKRRLLGIVGLAVKIIRLRRLFLCGFVFGVCAAVSLAIFVNRRFDVVTQVSLSSDGMEVVERKYSTAVVLLKDVWLADTICDLGDLGPVKERARVNVVYSLAEKKIWFTSPWSRPDELEFVTKVHKKLIVRLEDFFDAVAADREQGLLLKLDRLVIVGDEQGVDSIDRGVSPDVLHEQLLLREKLEKVQSKAKIVNAFTVQKKLLMNYQVALVGGLGFALTSGIVFVWFACFIADIKSYKLN